MSDEMGVPMAPGTAGWFDLTVEDAEGRGLLRRGRRAGATSWSRWRATTTT